MTLHNTRYLKQQIFEITPTGLKVDKKTPLDQEEFEISFEQIHNKMRIQTTTNSNLIVICIASAILGTLFLFGTLSEISPLFYIFSVVFLSIALITRKKTITIAIYTGGYIELFFNSDNKGAIEEYANQIINASNSFLLTKYGRLDKNLPLERQINDLYFLRDRGVLDEIHFEALKNQLLVRDNSNSIGFTR